MLAKRVLRVPSISYKESPDTDSLRFSIRAPTGTRGRIFLFHHLANHNHRSSQYSLLQERGKQLEFPLNDAAAKVPDFPIHNQNYQDR